VRRFKTALVILPVLVMTAWLAPVALDRLTTGATSPSRVADPVRETGIERRSATAAAPSGERDVSDAADPARQPVQAPETARSPELTDAGLDAPLALWEELVYSNQDPDAVLPEPGTAVEGASALEPRSPLSRAMNASLPEGFVLIYETFADDPSQYSSAVFDRADGFRAEASLFGPVVVDQEATLGAEASHGRGVWDGIGVYVLPRYGTIGQGSGPFQVLVGFDDGSLLNVTWRIGDQSAAEADHDVLLRITQQFASSLAR
jgi:hypothetical protein